MARKPLNPIRVSDVGGASGKVLWPKTHQGTALAITVDRHARNELQDSTAPSWGERWISGEMRIHPSPRIMTIDEEGPPEHEKPLNITYEILGFDDEFSDVIVVDRDEYQVLTMIFVFSRTQFAWLWNELLSRPNSRILIGFELDARQAGVRDPIFVEGFRRALVAKWVDVVDEQFGKGKSDADLLVPPYRWSELLLSTPD